MILYAEFKELVTDTILDFYPKDGVQRKLVEVQKYQNGEQMDGLSVVEVGHHEGFQASSVLYIKDLYLAFLDGGKLENVLIAASMVLQSDTEPRHLKYEDVVMQNWKSEVTAELVNRDKNEMMLKTVVWTSYLDLAVIYRLQIKHGDNISGTLIITPELLRVLGVSLEELHNLAIQNTQEKKPYILEDTYNSAEDDAGKSKLYLLSCEHYRNGAIALLYPEVLKKGAEIFGGDYYILPGSIHEMYFTVVEEWKVSFWKDTIKVGNRTLVKRTEFLSDSLYRYNSKTGEVEIVED